MTKTDRHVRGWLGALLGLVLLSGPMPVGAAPDGDAFAGALAAAALERTRHDIVYDGSYRRIPYPNGDVPPGVGVCTDVVIRAYRAVGIDLQRDVHEEMTAYFDAFPKRWGLARPDPNIDHRRVPNLRVLFERRGESLPVSHDPDDYAAGDLVTWLLGGRLPHIGVVSSRRSDDGARPLVVHNVGAGPKLEDVLFRYDLTGHYRYRGRSPDAARSP